MPLTPAPIAMSHLPVMNPRAPKTMTTVATFTTISRTVSGFGGSATTPTNLSRRLARGFIGSPLPD